MKKMLLVVGLLTCSFAAFATESSFQNDGSTLLAQNQMPVWKEYARVKVLCGNNFYSGTVYICRQNNTTYMKLKVNGQEFTDISNCSYNGRPRGEVSDANRDRYYNYCAGGKYYFYL